MKKAAPDTSRLAQIRLDLNKKFGVGTIRDMKTVEPAVAIPTGALLVDRALGIGGFPKGRMVELFGEESSGKSSLSLLAAAQCQQRGEAVLYMDFEHSFVTSYAELLGVSMDPDLFLFSQPEHLEQGFEILEAILSAGGVGLAVVDSLAAMIPRKELEGDVGDTFVAVQARAMSQALRRFTAAVDASQTCVIFINHTRFAIGGFNPTGQVRKTTPGGTSLKLYASHRVEMSRLKKLRGKLTDPLTGKVADGVTTIQFQARVVKNKLAPPDRVGYFYLDAELGHIDERVVLEVAIARGLVKASGSRIVLNDETFHGIQAATLWLVTHTDYATQLRQRVSDAMVGDSDGAPGDALVVGGDAMRGDSDESHSDATVVRGDTMRGDSGEAPGEAAVVGGSAMRSDSGAALGRELEEGRNAVMASGIAESGKAPLRPSRGVVTLDRGEYDDDAEDDE